MARGEGSGGLTSFGDLMMPGEAIEPILAKPVRAALTEWLTEIWAEPELDAVGIKPRKRAIFDGPPGVGKTTLAHHLCARIGLPMLAVRPERLISKWVGQTGMQIGELFDLAKRGVMEGSTYSEIVLFIDEFDAISPQRGPADQASDREANDYVNVLLQRLEQHPGFVIASTNYASHVDQAIWRRFDIHISLELPGQAERERILARYIAPFGMPKAALVAMGEALATASPALIRQFAENVKRQIVLGPRLKLPMGKGDVIDRLIASCHPHPDLGKPRLWSLGSADQALSLVPWPLPMASDLKETPETPPAKATGEVVPFEARR